MMHMWCRRVGDDEEELWGGRRRGGCFWYIHKSGIPQLPVLRIYPGDSHNAANVINRVNVPPRLQRTHHSGNDTLPPPPPSSTPATFPLITQLSNTSVRPHWSRAQVRLYIHVCLKTIRKQTAEPFHYLFIFHPVTNSQGGKQFFPPPPLSLAEGDS